MKEIKHSTDFKITSLGVQKLYVYDIEVEHNHNFFANNILVHNSCYINIGKFLDNNNIRPEFDKLPLDIRTSYVDRISKIICKYINDKSYNVTQKIHYNSPVDDFKIIFEPEKIALTGLFTSKKRYATWTLLDDGKKKDAMSITGLEVIRSDSPEIVKPKILNILEMILKKRSDDDLRNTIAEYTHELYSSNAEEIAENKGINKLSKYIYDDYKWKTRTPHQLKGVANYKFLLNKLKLTAKYEVPLEGVKAKIVYLMPNKFNKTSLSFYKWPSEFNKYGIKIDYKKMIDNNFTKKIKGLLIAINKIELLSPKSFF